MKRQTFAICALAALAVATACRRSELQNTDQKEITINSVIVSSTVTRAVANATTELKNIQFVRKDDANPTMSIVDFTGATPFAGTRAAADEAPITFDEPQNYDRTNNLTTYLFGYYPAGSLDQATNTVSWTPDGASDVMVSNLYNAGKFIEVRSEKLEFHHLLARIEVICASKTTNSAQTISSWGKITGVKLLNIPDKMTLNYANQKVTIEQSKTHFKLLSGADYKAGEFVPVDIQDFQATTPSAVGMVIPTGTKNLTLLVSTANQDDVEVPIILPDERQFVAGVVYQVRLNFDGVSLDIVPGASSIRDWDDNGHWGEGDVQFPVDGVVTINGVRWATGNLVAAAGVVGAVDAATDGAKVKIGGPTDGGLYFKLGSLVGWKGGAAAGGGRGVGMPDAAWNGKWWGGAAAWGFDNDALVWPAAMGASRPAAWPNNDGDNISTFDDYYFNYSIAPYSDNRQSIADYPGLMEGDLANKGVGDPCRYYLGGAWRLPMRSDFSALIPNLIDNDASAGPDYKTFGVDGVGLYCNTLATSAEAAKADPGAILFATSGVRDGSDGTMGQDYQVVYHSSLLESSAFVYTLVIDADGSYHYMYSSERNTTAPVRCVQGITLSSNVANDLAPVGASTFTLKLDGLQGSAWVLSEESDPSGAFTPAATSGTATTVNINVTANSTSLLRQAKYKVSFVNDPSLSATITLMQKPNVVVPQSILINGLKWATGNLVADASVTPGSGVATGTNGTKVKIGKPEDGGLYFQFGSLIGYKGGNVASSGRGTGIPHGATTTDPMPNDKYWGQAAAYSWANDAMVWPQTYTNGATTWPQGLTDNSFYFGLGADPYGKRGQKLSAFPDWESGGLVTTDIAVGDPCRYYLGGGWRMPTAEDWGKLFNSVYANGQVGGTWPGAGNVNWVSGTATKTVMAGIPDSNSATEGVGIYANTTATNIAGAATDPNALFFPASGYRHYSYGSFYDVGRYGYYWSGSVYAAAHGFLLYFSPTNVYPQNYYTRSYGLPVRCVSSVALSSDKAENTAPKEAGSFTLTVAGAGGEGWTLRETADASAAFTPSKTSGTGDGTFTVAVTANTTETPREASYTLSTASGFTATITLKQRGLSIEINGLLWAKGNLVADASVTPGSGVATGTNGTKVKIGEPTDGGLYFQFGSLIGYKGGNAASKGTGRGIPHGATTIDPMPDTKYWSQATAYSWANDAMVRPQAYTNGATTWPKSLTTNDYYFGLGADPYNKIGQKLSAYTNWESGGLVNTDIAVGDPCRYYLGGAWRMPTAEDWGKLFNSKYANGPVGGAWPGAGQNWGYGTATKTVMVGISSSINSATEGVGIYANTTATTEAAAKADPGALFFPASGYRNSSSGSFYNVGRRGYSWSGSVYDATFGVYLYFTTTSVYPQYSHDRSFGFPVRCVSEP